MEASLEGPQDERIIRAAESVIDEAVEFFSAIPNIYRKMQI